MWTIQTRRPSNRNTKAEGSIGVGLDSSSNCIVVDSPFVVGERWSGNPKFLTADDARAMAALLITAAEAAERNKL